jgi:hypothetical protein
MEVDFRTAGKPGVDLRAFRAIAGPRFNQPGANALHARPFFTG